jgi:putative glutamine amidotransferase
MINVAKGGTLHTDIYEVFEQAPRVHTPLPRKTIRVIPGRRLHEIIKKTRDRVNALHHQAVDRLGQSVEVIARDEYGMVQAIQCVSEPFVIGVQWHPEFMVFDSGQQKLYRALVNASTRHCPA